MHNLILLALAPLALANDLSKRSFLLPRQGGDAFKPGSTTVFDCANPCGTKWCLDLSRGDTCCTEGYACPGGNFCLTKGYCCPDGDDPATCASQFGITLPNGFKAGQTVAAGASTSASSPTAPSPTVLVPSPSSATPAASNPVASTSASLTPVTTSSATAPFAIPLTNSTLSPPSATGAPGGSPVLFTGGAMRSAVDGVFAAIAFAAAGLLM